MDRAHIRSLWALLALLTFGTSLTWANVRADHPTRTGKKLSLDERIARMSLEEKLGQLLIIDYSVRALGGNLSSPEAAVRELHIGGFWVKKTMNPDELRRATAYLQNASRTPLFFAADYERGAGTSDNYLTELPSNMAIGATRDPRLAEQAGRVVARESRALGVNLVFAPVADVNNNPANPIINIRSYGEDPTLVADMAGGFVKGAEQMGLLTTLKHFPGHGNTSIDSHSSLGSIPGSRKTLFATELLPYRRIFENGNAPAFIMTAHLQVPGLDPSGVPATFSKKILTDILRNELGYEGVIITDGINMGAIVNNFPYDETIIRPIEAGADVVLMPTNPRRAVAALREAVLSGRLTEERIDASVRRILAAKDRIELPKAAYSTDTARLTGSIAMEIGTFGHDVAGKIAERSITLLKNDEDVLPFGRGAKAAVVQMTYQNSAGSIGKAMSAFTQTLKSNQVTVTECRVLAKAKACDAQNATNATILAEAKNADVVVLALYLRPSERRGNVALNNDQAALARTLMNAGKSVVVVTFGNPYVIEEFQDAEALLVSYDQTSHSARAMAQHMVGDLQARGTLPVSVGNYGFGARLGLDLRPRTEVAPMALPENPVYMPTTAPVVRTF